MARHYTIKDFFRQMPNASLARFFHQRGLLSGLNFSAMKESKPDALLEAWQSLSENDRNEIDAIFQEIHELGCAKGFQAIIDEARWQLQDEPNKLTELIQTLSYLSNHYHRAIAAYLDHQELWYGATHFYHADTLSNWRKRKNLGHNSATYNKDALDSLANMIKSYFHNTEGRGNNCVVEVFRRGDLDYFFAYPEDHSQQNIEWINGEFGRRPHNPAFEIVFIYSQNDGTLDLHFYGSNKAVVPLQNMFAVSILKLSALPPDPKDSRVYDLNPLHNRNFNFIYSVGSGINHVALKKIRLTSRINHSLRITLEDDISKNPLSLYDQIDKASKGFPLNYFEVTQVELVVAMTTDAKKPQKNMSIRLTYPNSCSLKYDEIGLKLRKMLEASGIEPKDPTHETETREPIKA